MKIIRIRPSARSFIFLFRLIEWRRRRQQKASIHILSTMPIAHERQWAVSIRLPLTTLLIQPTLFIYRSYRLKDLLFLLHVKHQLTYINGMLTILIITNKLTIKVFHIFKFSEIGM